MGNLTLTEIELAYLAGIFDGEGSIFIVKRAMGLRKTRHSLVVALGMCNEYIPNLFKGYFGGSVQPRVFLDSKYQDSWQWKLYTREALNFLETLLPYLRVKKAEAELGIVFQKSLFPARWNGRGRQIPEGVLAIREAQRLLMHSLKKAQPII